MLDKTTLAPSTKLAFDVMQAITVGLKDLLFNQAHWKFAFQYHQGSRVMPYCLSGLPVPEAQEKSDKQLNTIFIFLNALFPLLEGIAYFLGDTAGVNQSDEYYFPI